MGQTYFATTHPTVIKAEQRKSLGRNSDDFEAELIQNAVLRLRKKSFVGVQGTVIVAAFDLDQTLISTKSGYVFPMNGNDWKLLPDILSQLAETLGRIESENESVLPVIFTNQGGVVPDRFAKSYTNLLIKLEGAGSALSRFPLIYASLKASDEKKKIFRKPAAGMFELLRKEISPQAKIDMERSFYVGDAAGRPNDHSRADIDFAKNAKLKFYTPEEYFGLQT